MAVGREAVPKTCWVSRSSSRNGSVRISIGGPPSTRWDNNVVPLLREDLQEGLEVFVALAGGRRPPPGPASPLRAGRRVVHGSPGRIARGGKEVYARSRSNICS